MTAAINMIYVSDIKLNIGNSSMLRVYHVESEYNMLDVSMPNTNDVRSVAESQSVSHYAYPVTDDRPRSLEGIAAFHLGAESTLPSSRAIRAEQPAL
eukprot:scaffold288676_cov23-Prasinocladus_malaysianus.AAC.1